VENKKKIKHFLIYRKTGVNYFKISHINFEKVLEVSLRVGKLELVQEFSYMTDCYAVFFKLFKKTPPQQRVNVQGVSNMTGTNCDFFTHK
jgi:hypothetical protein